MDEKQKPSLVLLDPKCSVEELVSAFEKIAGRKATPEEIEEVKRKRAAAAS